MEDLIGDYMNERYSNQEHLLSQILNELREFNKLKQQELKQQKLFIELIEEVLPIHDGKKRAIHQRIMRDIK